MNEESGTPNFAEAAGAAAAWWVEQIRAVTAETDGLHPGLTPEQAFVATAGIALRAQRIDRTPTPNDVTLAAFARRLALAIEDTTDRRLSLYVDYGPDPILRRAAHEAALSSALFPGKTRMQVYPDHIVAKAGYSARWCLAWSAPGWVHPACGVRDWPDDAEDFVGPECGLRRWHEGSHDWQRV